MIYLVDSDVFDFISVLALQKLYYNHSVPLSYTALIVLCVLPFFRMQAGEAEFVSHCK